MIEMLPSKFQIPKECYRNLKK